HSHSNTRHLVLRAYNYNAKQQDEAPAELHFRLFAQEKDQKAPKAEPALETKSIHLLFTTVCRTPLCKSSKTRKYAVSD
ncbi:MAG: hypothetical protein ACRDBM_07475, partial [Sporomusa sp.]